MMMIALLIAFIAGIVLLRGGMRRLRTGRRMLRLRSRGLGMRGRGMGFRTHLRMLRLRGRLLGMLGLLLLRVNFGALSLGNLLRLLALCALRLLLLRMNFGSLGLRGLPFRLVLRALRLLRLPLLSPLSILHPVALSLFGLRHRLTGGAMILPTMLLRYAGLRGLWTSAFRGAHILPMPLGRGRFLDVGLRRADRSVQQARLRAVGLATPRGQVRPIAIRERAWAVLCCR